MKKAIISLSAAAVLLLAGFMALPGDAFGADATETVIDTPEEISYITDIKSMPTGELILIGGNQRDKTLSQYISKDEGDTWQKECEYLEKLPVDMSTFEAVEAFGYVSDDGYAGICVFAYDKYLENVNEDNEDQLGIHEYFYIIDPDGNTTEVLTPETGEAAGGFYKVHFAGERAYFEDIRGNLYEVNRQSGEMLGKAMENTDFLFAVGVSDGDEVCAVTNDELGYPIDEPFLADTAEGEDSDEILYSFAAGLKGNESGRFYIADIDGISVYSPDGEKQLIYENRGGSIDKYMRFEDMAVIDEDTFIVRTWNEKSLTEELLKCEIQR